jgi:putative ABC transport system ATP-binding protein
MPMDMVILDNVSKRYRVGEMAVAALQDVTLRIPEKSFAALVGPSGSGKTTALNLMGCLDHPTTGRVTVAGQAIGDLNRRQSAAFRGAKLGFIFQDFSLLPVLTVYENVEYPLLMIRDMPPNRRRPEVEQVLAAVGMSDQADKYPAQLSGGQKQRTAIARALVGRPLLVLADEPTANLDGQTAQKVVELMKRMCAEFGTTFVFSTHDARIMDQAGVLFHLEDGRLIDVSASEGQVPHA